MILTLDGRLRKMMIVPSNVLGYFLQVAFYDHPMSLRMSRLHPMNGVTYQLMVWIALFQRNIKQHENDQFSVGNKTFSCLLYQNTFHTSHFFQSSNSFQNETFPNTLYTFLHKSLQSQSEMPFQNIFQTHRKHKFFKGDL